MKITVPDALQTLGTKYPVYKTRQTFFWEEVYIIPVIPSINEDNSLRRVANAGHQVSGLQNRTNISGELIKRADCYVETSNT